MAPLTCLGEPDGTNYSGRCDFFVAALLCGEAGKLKKEEL